MEVILRDHVDHLGHRGDIVKVADGYARNYLLPRKLALEVTEDNKRRIEREREAFEARGAQERADAEELARRVALIDCTIARRTGGTDTLYGSVTAAEIAQHLAAGGVQIDKRKIQLREPIKQIGEFHVPLKLHRDVTVAITVKVVKEEL